MMMAVMTMMILTVTMHPAYNIHLAWLQKKRIILDTDLHRTKLATSTRDVGRFEAF